MNNIYKQLFQEHLINDKQYTFLESIRTNKIVSVYYELRMILYIGIMLFTGGVGYFAYQNIGAIGHVISMILIGGVIGVGFYFINKFTKPYANTQVTINHAYFDYILILVSLLIITLFTYILVYFNLLELLINWTSFISTAILLFMAYRYDNRALLSMGITALAAAVGITITAVNWVSEEWFAPTDLYMISILLGASLSVIGQIAQTKDIKKHFKFTYQNFGLILYFIGCISATFDSQHESLYAILTLVSAGALSYYTWKSKEFLFFLYSNIAGYISITYLLFNIIDIWKEGYILMIYYFPLSCIGYILFLIKKKSHFAHD